MRMGFSVPRDGGRRARGGHGLLAALELLGPEAGPLGLAIGLQLSAGQQGFQLGPLGELVGGHQAGDGQSLGLVFVGHDRHLGLHLPGRPGLMPVPGPRAQVRN